MKIYYTTTSNCYAKIMHKRKKNNEHMTTKTLLVLGTVSHVSLNVYLPLWSYSLSSKLSV